jgi:hypothetical protein
MKHGPTLKSGSRSKSKDIYGAEGSFVFTAAPHWSVPESNKSSPHPPTVTSMRSICIETKIQTVQVIIIHMACAANY